MLEMQAIIEGLEEENKELLREYEILRNDKIQVIEDNHELSKMIEDTSAAADAKVKEITT